MLIELGLPSCNTVMHNAKVTFAAVFLPKQSCTSYQLFSITVIYDFIVVRVFLCFTYFMVCVCLCVCVCVCVHCSDCMYYGPTVV